MCAEGGSAVYFRVSHFINSFFCFLSLYVLPSLLLNYVCIRAGYFSFLTSVRVDFAVALASSSVLPAAIAAASIVALAECAELPGCVLMLLTVEFMLRLFDLFAYLCPFFPT